MRRPPAYLPPIVLQLVGVLVILGVLAAGVLGLGDTTLLAAVLGAGVTLAMLGGSFEKARYELDKALDKASTRPPNDPPSA